MTHQVNDSKLKEKDEKSILKLASKIEGKKSSIAEELEKISEKEKQRILTTEVSKHRGKEPTIALFTIIRTDRNMLLACYSHKHISYRIRTIIRKAILYHLLMLYYVKIV